MKILISGSRRHKDFTGNIEVFEKACEKVGEILAKNGHSIIVGSQKEETADLHVVRGYCFASCSCDESITYHVDVYRANKEDTPYMDIRDAVKGKVNFFDHESTGEWWVNRVEQVKNADCVLLICGGEGTLQSGLIAPTLEKPVVAICCFNGSAKEVWDRIESRYVENKKVKRLSNILKGEWKNGHEDHVIDMINTIRHVNTHLSVRNIINISSKSAYTLSVSIFIIFWVELFCNPIESKIIALFKLMCIASVLGAVTRNALFFLSEDSDIIRVGKISIEIGVSLVVGIGLTWIYFLFNGIVTGNFDFSLLNEIKNFQRISVIMSLIGLYSGFSLPEASINLSKLLSESISSEMKK